MMNSNMLSFTRSLAPLLRTSRLALRRQKGVNPLQQVFCRDSYGVRGMATVFERTKPHVNIGTQSFSATPYNHAYAIRNHWPR